MQILKVELRNIKSYAQSTVEFARGVNAVCGANGAGKSTILEAVGYALFDAEPYRPISQFRREGEKQSEILVMFEARDGLTYEVSRTIGRSAYFVYDPRVKRKVAEGKDVIDWLRENMGLDPSANLKTLFTDAVGVQQGRLTAPFLETPERRKGIFDPLLQVEDYKQAFENLRSTVRHLQDILTEKRERAARLAGRLEIMPQLERDRQELQGKITADESELAHVKVRLEQIENQKTILDTQKEAIDDLTSQLQELTSRLEGLERELDTAQKLLTESENAQQIVLEATQGYEVYRAAQNRLNELEAQRQERNVLHNRLQAVERELALTVQLVGRYSDQLVGIDEAEKQLESIVTRVHVQDQLETALRQAERDADRLQDAQVQLERQEGQLTKLRAELERVQAGLQERKQLEKKHEALIQQRDQYDRGLASIDSVLSDAESEIASTLERLQQAEQAVWEWEQAQLRVSEEIGKLNDLNDEIERIRTGLRHREKVQRTLTELEDQRRQWEQDIAHLNAETARIDERRQQLTERLALLQRAEGALCPVCQQPLDVHRAEELAARYSAEQYELDVQRNTVSQKREALNASLSEIKAQQKQNQECLEQLPLQDREAELTSAVKEQQARINQWQERVKALVDAPNQRDMVQAQYDALSQNAESERQKRQELGDERKGVENQITDVQARIDGLPHSDREQELVAEIEAQHQAITEQRDRVVSLGDALVRVTDLKSQLEALGDPRQESIRLRAETDKRSNVERDLAEARRSQAEHEGTKAKVETELGAFRGLDEAATEQREILVQHETDYSRYQQYLQIATQMSGRKTRVDEVLSEKQQAQMNCAQVQQDLETANSGYNAEYHKSLQSEHSKLTGEQGILQGRIQTQNEQLELVSANLEELQSVQAQLTKLEQERDDLSKLIDTVEFIRQTIKDAGPHVTKRLVRVLSSEANRIFGDILDDHTMQLRWGEDYGITVEQRGNEREFRQLSGGEQMAAALAVRLALLRQVGLDIAFFDEPTANLDEDRRHNLAEHITNIKGFSQLFVISHDDTFERETHHVVRVIKENGVSRVGD